MDERFDDDSLLAVLARVIDEADPVPADARATALAADMSGLDAELAELVFDSLLDERGTTLRDDAGDVRSLTFTTGDRTIEVDLADGGLVGRLSPAEDAPVELEQGTTRVPLPVDDLGRFRAVVRPGPLRLRVGGAGGAIATPWITR
ncbi:MAG TPA: hypothetical protein VH479_19410 [Acidimicrobiales bacterium]|jgi:hypothetical protein